MKTLHLLFLIAALAAWSGSPTHGADATLASPLEIPTTSPAGTVRQRVGATDIEINYSRPSAKGRTIFGGLVPFDHVWRTGANSATTVTFSTPVTLNGVAVPAGTFELFTIPGADEWTVIIHRDQSQWGSYAYDPANDIARIPTRSVVLHDPVETLTIGINDVAFSSATLGIAWATTLVPVTVEVDVVGQMVPRIEAALQGEGRKPYFAAAMFYYEHDLDLEKAATWMRAALEQRPNHIGMLHRLALILAKQGDREGAIAAARQSRDLAAEAAPELREEYTRLNTALLSSLGES